MAPRQVFGFKGLTRKVFKNHDLVRDPSPSASLRVRISAAGSRYAHAPLIAFLAMNGIAVYSACFVKFSSTPKPVLISCEKTRDDCTSISDIYHSHFAQISVALVRVVSPKSRSFPGMHTP